MPIRNVYAYINGSRNRNNRGTRQLDRVDASIGRRMLNEQEYVYVIVNADGTIDSVTAGYSMAKLFQSSNIGSRIVKKRLVFMSDVFDA